MKIKLISGPDKNPIDISIGSARSCYSKTLKDTDSIKDWEGKIGLGEDLLFSGHHTTLQHANFTFSFEEVSRLVIWRFFHSHRFYNSDQVSQRYAAINTEEYYKESNLDNEEDIDNLHDTLIGNYLKIIDLLEVNYKNSENKVEKKIAKKKAMENARYILPQSIYAHMYHTINLSTLIRYYAVSEAIKEGHNEIKDIISEMVRIIIEKYPDTKTLFEKTKKIKSQTIPKNKNFDFINKEIDMEIIKINTTGLEFAGDYDYYSDTSGSYSLFAQPEAMDSFVVRFDISLTADAQNQRHRTSIGIRPQILEEFNKLSTYEDFLNRQYIPDIFNENKEAKNIFISSIKEIYKVISNTKESYIPYLIPNSFKITIVETTNLSDFAHKAKMRLCLNAQEEIRFITENMVELLDKKEVDISLFVPPCVSRFIAGKRPICPEGSRYCGVKEWKKDKYKKIIEVE